MDEMPASPTRDTTSIPQPGPQLDPRSTAAFAVLWIAIVATGWAPLEGHSGVSRLYYPVDSAERVTSRDLELAESIERSPDLERSLLQGLHGTLDEALGGSIRIQRELVAELAEGRVAVEDPEALDRARARLSLLLAETGSLAEALEIAGAMAAPAAFAAALQEAYSEQELSRDSDGGNSTFAQAGLFDWYFDRARIARALGAGEVERADATEARLLERGARWKRRSLAVFGANFALVVLGTGLVATRLRRVREIFGSSGAVPPWSLATGLGVFVRGDCWNRLYFLCIPYLDRIPILGPQLAGSAAVELLHTWATLFAALPLLWLVHRHLLAPTRSRAVEVFGIRRPGLRAARVVRVSLVAISVDLIGAYVLGWATWGLGIQSNWAEGFDEMLVWGSFAQAMLTSTDYVLWTPVMEELAFRGVLYFSLRRSLGATSAALLTATFFALMHLYSLPGFLVMLWSGFVWALAFERVHSLLPGIAAHAVYNALFVLGLVLLYR
jgi:membrane protease YdiL (CAAX protease family)